MPIHRHDEPFNHGLTFLTSIAVRQAAVCAFALLCTSGRPAAQPLAPYLWSGAAPGAVGDSAYDKPYLKAYLPLSSSGNRTAMVVCPGGGYCEVDTGWEGVQAGSHFSGNGVVCFVLYYRTGDYATGGGYTYPQTTADVKRAMRYVRGHAGEYGIDTSKIGIVGFSAGGHLASYASTQFDYGDPTAPDPVDRLSSRPAFSILIYPVITMNPALTYVDGIPYFFGTPTPSQALIDSFSNEKHVNALTPRTFLAQDPADDVVPYINSTMYRDSCIAHGVPVKHMPVPGCGHGWNEFNCDGFADTVSAWLGKIGMLGGTAAVGQAAHRDAKCGSHGFPQRQPHSAFDLSGRKLGTTTHSQNRILPSLQMSTTRSTQ